jgi:hypothetical protein
VASGGIDRRLDTAERHPFVRVAFIVSALVGTSVFCFAAVRIAAHQIEALAKLGWAPYGLVSGAGALGVLVLLMRHFEAADLALISHRASVEPIDPSREQALLTQIGELNAERATLTERLESEMEGGETLAAALSAERAKVQALTPPPDTLRSRLHELRAQGLIIRERCPKTSLEDPPDDLVALIGTWEEWVAAALDALPEFKVIFQGHTKAYEPWGRMNERLDTIDHIIRLLDGSGGYSDFGEEPF